jgi:hypothetical protein
MFEDGMGKQDQPMQMIVTRVSEFHLRTLCYLQYFYQLDSEMEG